MRRALSAGVIAALALGAPAAARAADVSIQFQAFGPSQVDVLPGESVVWTNVSMREHTVNADDGSFDSGALVPGAVFTQAYAAVGSYPYHCTIHPSMTGEVDVRSVTLGVLPTAAVPAGDAVVFDGRTADPALPVRIQRADGGGFQTVATATPAADGTWSVAVAAMQTGDYRAATDAGFSETRRLRVIDRRITVRATRTGVAVTVTPALPYGQIVLQQYELLRFGWWPQARARLDYVSQARVPVRRPARVRVALVDSDGWTPLVISRVLTLRR